MKFPWSDELATIHNGDCRDVMATFDPESIDAVVTDPPYGLDFMGKDWDRGVPGVGFWRWRSQSSAIRNERDRVDFERDILRKNGAKSPVIRPQLLRAFAALEAR